MLLVLGVLALRVTLLIFSPTLRLTLVYNQLYLARQSSCSPTALITTYKQTWPNIYGQATASNEAAKHSHLTGEVRIHWI